MLVVADEQVVVHQLQVLQAGRVLHVHTNIMEDQKETPLVSCMPFTSITEEEHGGYTGWKTPCPSLQLRTNGRKHFELALAEVGHSLLCMHWDRATHCVSSLNVGALYANLALLLLLPWLLGKGPRAHLLGQDVRPASTQAA